jgi:hypothetical protein
VACLFRPAGWVPLFAFLALLMGDPVGIEIEDFIRIFEYHSGHTLEDLRSTDLAQYIQKFQRRLRVGSAWRSASS